MNSKSRHRYQFKFWLDENRDEDHVVYDLIQKLKHPLKGQGQFTRAIREGLRIWYALKNHDLSVLFEFFPEYKEQFTTAIALKEFMDMLKHQPVAPALAPMGQGSTGKMLTAQQFALPTFDEDDDDAPTLVMSANTDTDASANFLTSFKALG